MKLHKSVKIKGEKKNFIKFQNLIFVYTDIEVSLRKLTYRGVAVDKLAANDYIGYKDSTVELDVLTSASIWFYLISFVSTNLLLKSITRYRDKYRDNDFVDVRYGNLGYGEKLGYFKLDSKSNESFFPVTCATIVNHLVEDNYKKEKYRDYSHSFSLKGYASIQYTKIS